MEWQCTPAVNHDMVQREPVIIAIALTSYRFSRRRTGKTDRVCAPTHHGRASRSLRVFSSLGRGSPQCFARNHDRRRVRLGARIADKSAVADMDPAPIALEMHDDPRMEPSTGAYPPTAFPSLVRVNIGAFWRLQRFGLAQSALVRD